MRETFILYARLKNVIHGSLFRQILLCPVSA